MGLTYNYGTRQITRDFVLKRAEGDCRRDPEKTTLIGVMCRTCPFYNGERTYYEESKQIGHFIHCKFHTHDDEESEKIIREMYNDFETEALRHFYD